MNRSGGSRRLSGTQFGKSVRSYFRGFSIAPTQIQIQLTFAGLFVMYWFAHISVVSLLAVLAIPSGRVMSGGVFIAEVSSRSLIDAFFSQANLSVLGLNSSRNSKFNTYLQFKQTPPDFLPLSLNSSILNRHFLAWPLQLQAKQRERGREEMKN